MRLSQDPDPQPAFGRSDRFNAGILTPSLSALLCLCALLAVEILLTAGCVHCAEQGQSNDGAAGAASRYLNWGTNRIHYEVTGKGCHAVVLVHCWGGNLGFWREQVPALAQHARIISIDLPGHGQSDKPDAEYTMDYFAQSVVAVMSDAHVRKATLVGHSMGAAVICRVYTQAPESVAALVALDGALRRPDMPPGQAEGFIAGIRDPGYLEHTRDFLRAMFPIPGTEPLRDQVVSEMLETPQYVLLGSMKGMFGQDQPNWDLGHCQVPVLVINAESPMWTDDYKDYVRSLSTQSEYRQFTEVGHWLMLEKPAEFNATLLAMLRHYNLIDP